MQRFLTADSFKILGEDGSQFEALVADLLDSMGYKILEKPAVGTEGGRDILVERTIADSMAERRELVIVQCKHKAIGGRAVGDSDIGPWQNAMLRYRATGYLLVTDTRITENLAKSFREFTAARSSEWAAAWTVDDLIRHVNANADVRTRYFGHMELDPTSPLSRFVSEVSIWLRVARYAVSQPRTTSSTTADMSAVMQNGPIRYEVVVRCVAGMITAKDVRDLADSLTSSGGHGWLVCDRRIASSARTATVDFSRIRVSTLSELLCELWTPYIDVLTQRDAETSIEAIYVDRGCYREDLDEDGNEIHREQYESLDSCVDDWLAERGKAHLSLLGEFGTGKTWFARHYTSRQLRRFLDDPARHRLPLLVDLKDFSKAASAQQLINYTFTERYKLDFSGSTFELLDELNRRGKIVWILDGFDEMARKVDYDTIVRNFWSLAELVQEDSKVVLTSRTEYFRWARDSEAILTGAETVNEPIRLSRPRFDVLYVQPLTWEQTVTVIERRFDHAQAAALVERISKQPALREMARKPIMVELLHAAMEEGASDSLDDLSRVYHSAIRSLLIRNIAEEKTFTSIRDKVVFLCELGWAMIDSGQLKLHFREFPDRIRACFPKRLKDSHEVDIWDYDLRNQTLLHRDVAGYYEFAHASLAEYFVAYRLAAHLGCLSTTFHKWSTDSGDVCPVEPDDVAAEQVLNHLDLAGGQGHTVRRFLVGMLDSERTDILWNLLDFAPPLVDATGHRDANLATLLNDLGFVFRGRSLSGRNLTGADLRNADLVGADLSGATLNDAHLSDAKLGNVSLRDANLQEVHIDHVGGIKDLAFVGDGSTLVSTASDASVHVWDCDTSGPPQSPRAHHGYVRLVGIPGSDAVVLADRTGLVKRIDLRDFTALWTTRTDPACTSLGASADGRKLALIRFQDGGVEILNAATGSREREIVADDLHYGYDVSFSPDAQHFVAANVRDGATVWNVTGERVAALEGHASKVECARFSGCGQYILTAGYDNAIRVWSAESYELLHELDHGEMIPDITCSTDGSNLLAVADHGGKVTLYELDGFEKREVLAGHTGSVFATAFSRDGASLATGGRDAHICVWCVRTGKLRLKFAHPLRCDGLDLNGVRNCEPGRLALLIARGGIGKVRE